MVSRPADHGREYMNYFLFLLTGMVETIPVKLKQSRILTIKRTEILQILQEASHKGPARRSNMSSNPMDTDSKSNQHSLP